MSFLTGTATDVGDLIDQLDAFLLLGHSLDPQYAGTGDGTITLLIGTAATVDETITCTATDATHFTVVGSISGALGTAVVGTAFTCAVAHFTIVAGGTAFVATDTISFVMTLPWTALRSTTGQEYIWSAPGNDGLANIIVGVHRFTSVAGDYDNLQLLGAFGFDTGQDFWHQPGGMTDEYVPLLRVGSMPFWFCANGRRVVIVVKVSTTYQSAYLGFINAYASPSQFPYPLAIGGSMSWGPILAGGTPAVNSPRWRWSYSGNEMHAFAISYSVNTSVDANAQMRLRTPDGTWKGFDFNSGNSATPGKLWPYCGFMNNLRANLDGSYFLMPILLTYDDGLGIPAINMRNTYGELDGVSALTGYNQVSENTNTINRIQWLVVQDTFRTTTTDYFALKLA
jgi:hypothetical protein